MENSTVIIILLFLAAFIGFVFLVAFLPEERECNSERLVVTLGNGHEIIVDGSVICRLRVCEFEGVNRKKYTEIKDNLNYEYKYVSCKELEEAKTRL